MSAFKNIFRFLIKAKNSNSQRGFSLIELLVVMVILGLIATLVGPALFSKLGTAKQKTAKSQIEMLGAALDAYRLDMGTYPSDLGGLVENKSGSDKWDGPYIRKSVIPKDPWDEEYHYQFPGEHGEFDLYSYGSDKQPGGDGEKADVVSWE